MASQGWIALHRSIREHWIYQEDRTFSKYEAWLDLLMDVNHQKKKFMFDGQLIDVERGQKITSIRQLCERWNWSNTKVNKFLSLLESDGMLIKKSDAKKTVITIVNYDFYQGEENEKTTPKRQRNVTETSEKHTNNNVNNDNNVNNIVVVVEEPQNVVQAYEQVFGMANSFMIENLDYWSKDLSPELVIAALKESAEGNAYSFKYTESILRTWEKNNVKTLDDVEALNKKFEKQNASKYQQPNKSNNQPQQKIKTNLGVKF